MAETDGSVFLGGLQTLQIMSASPFSWCSTCHSQQQQEGTYVVLTWVPSDSCNLHAQTKQAAFQLENELQGAYHGVKGKHAVNTGLPARNGGSMGAQSPLLSRQGEVRSPGRLQLDSSGVKIQCSGGSRMSLGRRCWAKAGCSKQDCNGGVVWVSLEGQGHLCHPREGC